ncbi:MAG: gliding motility lipoprotein GldJ [Flavobacteriaceae bacterium]|jgi:gliding motility-associated lipoprotein GldJ|nr:gliding motility lipoprotein GldJ [Flavobacteriaceae bacterium]MDO7582446.1 gliding motility lipoprotein GldJ [Flavobacteriaceae bacterium]MDO7591167.1 gliding motility lipoprotein GldJ [Flavobacteriaceae bacterium]MDO7599785.1 gliding motility lipoprotein GldJ [Flavobacteriaceae bacterium]MDO7602682.1 gliding motility lipoprotein GldJ [Flavobacteriaceae bacterium]
MRINLLFINFTLIVFTALIITSCGNNRNESRATGWGINSKKGGFEYNLEFDDQETGPGLVFIEGGTFTKGQVQDDVMHDWNNAPNKQHVMSFYIDETEVTNLMYLEYLDWINYVFPQENNDYKKLYQGALPDTLVWRNQLGYFEELTSNYLRHPAYAEYPVVGVNWLQAVQFAEWRTDRVNEFILERESYIEEDVRYNEVDANSTFSTGAYLKRPKTTYGGKMDSLLGKNGRSQGRGKNDSLEVNVYAGIDKGILLPSYRLPTESEWEYAALALVGDREYNTYRGKKKYPWSGEYTRSEERRSEGDQLANFKLGKGDYGGIAGWSDDGADITIQVKSYPPNDFGVYDMGGNVAEWVADVYRPIVDDEASDFNYYRGNIYLKDVIGEDGKAEVIDPNKLVYDTLPNGKILIKRLPGQLKKQPIDEEETYLRQNFTESDNRNFRDGDVESTLNYSDKSLLARFNGGENEEGGTETESSLMYDAPQNPEVKVVDNKQIRKKDISTKRTSMITDEVRVFKGGSWKDRAYWLDPAQRRYLPQYIATDYIGFRCAMTRLGSKSKAKKTARHKRKG